MAITKAQQARQMLRDGTNYNPSKIVSVPKEFKARKDSPNTKLAYITKDEEKLLKKLKPGTPHKGPEGIPNYDSFDISGGYTSGRDIDDRTGQAKDPGQRFSGGTKQQEKETRERNLRNLAAAEKAQKERLAQQKAIEEKEKRQKEIREKELKRQRELKEKRSRIGFDTTSKYGTPVGPMSPQLRDIIGLEKIELAKSAIEEDDPDDVATAKAIGEQNPLQKFLSNIPSTTGIIGSILEEIPGKSLSEMYEDYGKTEKFKSRFPGIDTFEEYQQAVLDGKISAKGGLMGGFTPGGVQTTKDGTIQLFQGGQDNEIIPPVPPTTTGSVLGPTDFKKAEVDNRTEFEKLLASRPGAFRFFADGGMADDDDLVGGIMDLESGRQMYLGGKLVKSIGKGLKSITKGIKKVAKSPIGKAAILGAIGFGIPGTQFGGLFGTAAKKGILGKYGLGQTLGIMGKSPRALGGKTPGLGGLLQRALGFVKDKPLTSIFGASILAGLTPQEKQKLLEQEEEEGLDIAAIRRDPYGAMGGAYSFYAEGGKAEPVAKKTMPLLDMDGMEKDYRETGGFVEMGRMERADDVPARLSKNEFVFTADAVRNAGDGNIDKGAEVMYNMMKNLEAGGEVSEESQGLEGARKMFQTSQRLGEVI